LRECFFRKFCSGRNIQFMTGAENGSGHQKQYNMVQNLFHD
jgi:hypothetical protein